MTRTTVVIPTYNAAGTICSTLGSVAAQTRRPDQVVVVDDGSTDETLAHVCAWKRLLPIDVVALGENIGRGLGAGGARARGIEAADGEVIALLDADDFWFPEHLDVLLDAHARHGGLISGNYLLWVPGRSVGCVPASELVPVPDPDDQPLEIISENFVFVSSVFSRELYDRAGGFRNIRCEDWDLWIRMVRAGARVHMPSTPTALYRQDPASVSGTDKLLIGDIDLLTELLDDADDAERPVIERALRRRYAKQAYLAGVRAADAGDIADARASMLRALRLDPSLTRNRSRLNGRTALRAAGGLVAPRTLARRRQARQQDPERIVGRGPNVTGVIR